MRLCDCRKQVFLSKGRAQIRSFLPSIMYKIEGILTIRTCYSMNKECEEQKVNAELALELSSLLFILLLRWMGSGM